MQLLNVKAGLHARVGQRDSHARNPPSTPVPGCMTTHEEPSTAFSSVHAIRCGILSIHQCNLPPSDKRRLQCLQYLPGPGNLAALVLQMSAPNGAITSDTAAVDPSMLSHETAPRLMALTPPTAATPGLAVSSIHSVPSATSPSPNSPPSVSSPSATATSLPPTKSPSVTPRP